MIWLTVTEYLCHKWPRVCSVWPQFGPFLIHDLFSNSSYHRVCNKSSITYGTGTGHPSGAPEFTPVFSLIRIARSVVFCVMFCLCFFLSFCASVLSVVLQHTASAYPFGILWPLCCLSFFNIRLLNTPLVYLVAIVLSVILQHTASEPLWYLQTFLTHIFIFCFHVLNSVLWCPLRFLHKKIYVRFVFPSSCV